VANHSVRILTQPFTEVHSLEWSPDGAWIAIGNDADIIIIAPDGQTQRTVASGEMIEFAGWMTVPPAQ